MQISMFGTLRIEEHDRHLGPSDLGGRQPKVLLELLLLARGHLVSREALAMDLWGDSPPRSASAALDTYVAELRRQLWTDPADARLGLVTEADAYRLATDVVSVDLDRFDDLVNRAERAGQAERTHYLESALELAVGGVLEDEPGVSWARFERDLYEDRVIRTRIALARDLLLAHQPTAALRHAEEARRTAPYAEDAVRTTMLAAHALGRCDLARRTYERCRATLGSDLGVDPTTETIELAGAIDAGAPPEQLITELRQSRFDVCGWGRWNPAVSRAAR